MISPLTIGRRTLAFCKYDKDFGGSERVVARLIFCSDEAALTSKRPKRNVVVTSYRASKCNDCSSVALPTKRRAQRLLAVEHFVRHRRRLVARVHVLNRRSSSTLLAAAANFNVKQIAVDHGGHDDLK